MISHWWNSSPRLFQLSPQKNHFQTHFHSLPYRSKDVSRMNFPLPSLFLGPLIGSSPFSLSKPHTKLTTLSNGLRVVSEKRGDLATSTMGMFISVGSAYETKANNGCSHFLEHMAFKGTHTRSQETIENSIENIGAHLNAYTSREHTVFMAKIFPQHTRFILSLLRDILFCPQLDPSAIRTEAQTILRELDEVENQAEEVLFDKLHTLAFRSHGLGRTILGPRSTIQKMTQHQLQQYVRRFYTPERMTLVSVGPQDHSFLVEVTKKMFSSVSSPGSRFNPDCGVGGLPTFHQGATVFRYNNPPSSLIPDAYHFAIGFKSGGWNHPDHYAFSLLQSLFGQTQLDSPLGVPASPSSSSLGETLKAAGLVSHSSSYHTVYTHTGMIGFTGTSDPSHSITSIFDMTFGELHRLATSLSEQELEIAKQRLFCDYCFSLDDSNQAFDDIGRQILAFRKRFTLGEIHRKIMALSLDDIRRIIRKDILSKKAPLVLALSNPIREEPHAARSLFRNVKKLQHKYTCT